jgi:3-oxoacyl-[acyl-carrier-protein] synthase II
MSLGEGAAFLALERLQDARRRGARVHALLLGEALSCDAGHLTAPDPRGAGLAQALREALDHSRVKPADIAFVNAHGTGTLLNDESEVAALAAVFGPEARRLLVHSAKGTLGHTLGAAGALEAVVTIASLAEGAVPHTAGLTRPMSDAVDLVCSAPRRLRAPLGVSTSVGFGGNNAALVFGASEVR